MDITPYVESLRRDLLAAADSGSAETRAAAERLTLALDPALRMALLEALSQAADEITCELPEGCTVDVRLKGRDPEFAVALSPTSPLPSESPAAPGPPESDEDEDDGAVARITLRLPESVKSRAEDLAAKSGQSLNAWLVSAVRSATRERAIDVDIDLSSIPFFESGFRGRGRGLGGQRRMTGWV